MVSLLTYKIHVPRNFLRNSNKRLWYDTRRRINKYIRVARRIAQYAILHKKEKITSKTVKTLGTIPSIIACQTIRKYKNNKTCKKISNVNLIVPACSTVKYPSVIHDQNSKVLLIKPLKMKLRWNCPVEYNKINQIEINNEYCYVTVTIEDIIKKQYQEMIGVDLNIKHNLAAVGNPKNKHVEYLGRNYIYQRVKYKEIRKRFQKQNRLHKVKELGNKEQRVMNDLNHKLSKRVLDISKEQTANVSIEDLTGIRQTARSNKSFRYFLNSWSFYQFRIFLEYKAEQRYGCLIVPVDPKYTSQDCSSCGERTKCNGKKYQCSNQKCKLEIHRDENSSYNIANKGKKILQSVELH